MREEEDTLEVEDGRGRRCCRGRKKIRRRYFRGRRL